ncbi:carboxymuconolactone decarboxylase family protein [Planococcus salinus]|uniref:Gamma-carboxymuconolactone decarboxylase n=1 Tax=Planococcus salinus TaxID=1848460 RepID=A0A3M8P847_9BACL|nr:carboxymuconolactone decarboxylase family protein [Planococcus salinus]RNF39792.1 gamma-carboxymuconolactone decarboxylase [Planococcus salinus]
MTNLISQKGQELKEEFKNIHGYWNDGLEELLQLDEDFFGVYVNFISIPWKTGSLQPKVKELINIAISSSPTHLSMPATRIHIRNALRLGASKEEITEVLETVSILGVHTCSVGIPLMEEVFGIGDMEQKAVLSVEQEQLKSEFIGQMGYWNDFRDVLLKMDPSYFEAYMNFLTSPLKKGILEPKVIEFIYIAIDSSTTHLFGKGIEVHLRNALKYGASKEEILEVFQLTSSQGFHTVFEAVPVLLEEIELWESEK